MRLTLRTLLAYIDGVLDPQIASELEGKIRESRIAQNTMERIDDGLASKSIGIPVAGSRTNDFEANKVAEYLDNTLPPEQLPAFEKVCFENDAQLIEVAAVHRILSVVLTKPALISEPLRRRIKQLRSDAKLTNQVANLDDVSSAITPPIVNAASQNGSHNSNAAASVNLPASGAKKLRLDSAHQESPAASSVSSTQSLASAAEPASSEMTRPPRELATQGLDLSDQRTNAVPEYLRDRSEGMWTQVAIASTLVAALLVVAWLSIGSWDQVRSMFSEPVQTTSGPTTETVPSRAIAQAPIVQADKTTPLPASEIPAIAVAATIPSVAPENSITQSDIAPPANNVAVAEGPVKVDAIAPPGAESVPPVSESPPMVGPVEVASADAPPPSPTAAIATAEVQPPMILPAGNEPPATIPTPTGPIEKAFQSQLVWQPETKDTAAAVVLSLPSEAINGDLSKLRAVNVAEVIPLNERLIVPDAYRTELRIQPGLKWLVATASDIQGESGDEAKVAYVRLRLGRAMINSTPECNTLRLSVGNAEYRLTMETPNTIASIELKYFPAIGQPLLPTEIAADANGKTTPVQPFVRPVLTIVTVDGKVSVRSREGLTWSPPDLLEPGQAISWIDNKRNPTYTLREIPWWYRTSTERPIDIGAAEDLAIQLRTAAPQIEDDPVATEAVAAQVAKPKLVDVLQQATTVRRAETAALAARTLVLLGHYESVFGRDAILNQAASRPHRTLILDSVFQSLGIDDSRRRSLATILNAFDPPRGPQIVELFSLPDDATLKDAAGAQYLIDSLSSSFLDQRSLAIYQLTRIVGKELAYQPDRVTSESLLQWRKMQNAGKIEWGRNSIKPLDIGQ